MMKDYLVFRLYGPMASWGEPAVGGDRPTGIKPTRSALLGLLGAALGIKRSDEGELRALQSSVTFAVKQCVPSSLLRDYHTTQVPSQQKNVVHQTRQSELAQDKLNTILSSRDYRCDGLWIVAVSLTAQASYGLQQLEQALRQPVFTLSLGRKSCPLALPLQPKQVQVASLKAALDTPFASITHSDKSDQFWLSGNGLVTYFWEGERTAFDSPNVLTTHPWDEPLHRGRWQFKQRELHQVSLQEAAHVSV